MSSQMYKLLVFVGRFQPFHMGHKIVVDKALELADEVLLLIGSNGDERTLRNPWTWAEREQMIRSVYPDNNKLFFAPVFDRPEDNDWIDQVDNAIQLMHKQQDDDEDYGDPYEGVGLIGCNKDHTSYYLELFPHLKSEAVEFISPLNATDIREMLWERKTQKHELIDTVMPHSVVDIVTKPDMGMDSERTAEQLRQNYLEGKRMFDRED